MFNFLQQIKELEESLKSANSILKTFRKDIEKLKSQSLIDQQTISNKDKELKSLENKLFECSKARKDIEDGLDKKVEELEKSNLSKEEISQQIIQLFKGGFTGVREKVLKSWSKYAKAKDSFSELQKNLSNSRLGAIQSLEKTKRNLWITVWILLAAVILLSLSLCYYKKKKKNRIKPPFLKESTKENFPHPLFFSKKPPNSSPSLRASALLKLILATIGGKTLKKH